MEVPKTEEVKSSVPSQSSDLKFLVVPLSYQILLFVCSIHFAISTVFCLYTSSFTLSIVVAFHLLCFVVISFTVFCIFAAS